jgi:hypothetical protein
LNEYNLIEELLEVFSQRKNQKSKKKKRKARIKKSREKGRVT